MAATENLVHLYERYKFERANTNLSIDAFEELLYIFPAILVAYADGHLDTTELIHLNKLAPIICAKLPTLSETDVKQEIRYLSWNYQIWRTPILNTLKELVQIRNNGHDVLEIMISTASSSTGSLINNILLSTINPGSDGELSALHVEQGIEFISNDEKEEIKSVIRALGLHLDPAIQEKLNQIF